MSYVPICTDRRFAFAAACRQATDFIGFFQELKQHQPNVRQHHRQEDRRQQDQGTDENSSRWVLLLQNCSKNGMG